MIKEYSTNSLTLAIYVENMINSIQLILKTQPAADATNSTSKTMTKS